MKSFKGSSFFRVVFVLIFCLPMVVLGATTTSSTEEVATPEPGKLVGTLDLRPTWTTKKGTWITDNSLEMGYKPNANTQFSYCQFFATNLYSEKSGDGGLGLSFPGAFVRAKFNNLWKSSDETWAFHYQPRLYLPLDAADREVGQITIVRNYFTFSKTVTDEFSLTFVELPMLHLYNKAGAIDPADGEPFANPIFENRVYLMADFAFSEKLSLSLPLFIHAKRYRNFQAGAFNNSAWSFLVYTWPELTYSLTDKASLGLAYYSGNLVSADLSDLTLGSGLEDGAVQVAVTLSL